MVPIRRLLAHRSLAWLLWLALVLPAAQAAAVVHGYAHTGETQAGHDDKAAPHGKACDLCLTAASVASGGAAVAGDDPPLLPSRHACPGEATVERRFAAPALGYRSRAPPLLRT